MAVTESAGGGAAGPGRHLELSGEEKAKIFAIYAALIGLTVIGFAASIIIGRVSPLLAGLGVICYILGLRHSFDCDHIAAIDNTTRKLIHQGKKPSTVGMWFSLGHSTIVVALIVALVFVSRFVIGTIPALESGGAIAGTLISGIFLFLIGVINTVIVFGIYRAFKAAQQGKMDEAELEEMLNNRGFMNRFLRPLFSMVDEPWQIYPIGVLFGLGFDTATEVALIAISVGAGVSDTVPLWMILVLPFMFTCGMVLVDTSDGVIMRMAYGWAFLNPLRKIFYNLTITVISVLVAFAIGAIELLQVLSAELKLTGPFFGLINNLDFESLGYVVVAIFVVSWIASTLWWRYKGYDRDPPSQRMKKA
jgi:high-affinity nickel-transport protein